MNNNNNNNNNNMGSEPPISGALTIPMDFDSEEYKAHRKILDEKVNSMTPEQKRQVELLSMKYKVQDYLNNTKITENEIITVGDFLRMYLNKLNIKQNKFADYIGIQPPNFNKILSGQRNVSIELSLILGQLFQIDPKVWLQLQLKNDYIKMEKKKDDYKHMNVQYAMAV